MTLQRKYGANMEKLGESLSEAAVKDLFLKRDSKKQQIICFFCKKYFTW